MLFGFALVFYLALILAVTTGQHSGLVAIGIGMLWLLIALIMLLGGARGWMPRWAALACCVVVPLSWWVAWQCVRPDISDFTPSRGQLVVFAALPVPLVLYAFWAHFPILHRGLPPTGVTLAMLAAVVSLAAAPYVDNGLIRWAASTPAAAIVGRASDPADVLPTPSDAGPAKPATTASPVAPPEGADHLAKQAGQLTPDSPLAAYVPFFVAGGEARRDALARARLLDSRQSQAESLLARGTGLDPGLADLWLLNLMPGPTLCQTYATQLTREAEQARGRDGFWIVSDRIEPHLETINWLVSARCDLSAALLAVQSTAAGYPASPERERFLDAIGSLLADTHSAASGDPALCAGPETAPLADRLAACTTIVRSGRAGFGRLRTALVTRGNLHYAIGDYPNTIADYTAALRLPPRDPRVLVNLGNAYEAAGDHDTALRTYDASIALDPNSALAFNNRGASREAHGDHAGAVIDLDVAIRLDPTYATAFANRGRAYYFLGQFRDAASNFERVLKLRVGDARAALWRNLAARRGHLPAATALGDDTAAADHSHWPWPLVAVFLGEHDLTWGEQAALNANAVVQAAQSCDAAFYLGEARLIDGAPTEARALLRQAAAGCPATAVEGQAAKSELARSDK